MNKVIINLGTSMQDVSEQHSNLPQEVQELIFTGIQVKEQVSLVDEMVGHLGNSHFMSLLESAVKNKNIVIGAKPKALTSSGRGKRLNQNQKNQLKEMYLEGKGMSEIAAAVGTTPQTVNDYIKKFKAAAQAIPA